MNLLFGCRLLYIDVRFPALAAYLLLITEGLVWSLQSFGQRSLLIDRGHHSTLMLLAAVDLEAPHVRLPNVELRQKDDQEDACVDE